MASMIQLQHLRVSTPKQVENVSSDFFPLELSLFPEGDDVLLKHEHRSTTEVSAAPSVSPPALSRVSLSHGPLT